MDWSEWFDELDGVIPLKGKKKPKKDEEKPIEEVSAPAESVQESSSPSVTADDIKAVKKWFQRPTSAKTSVQKNAFDTMHHVDVVRADHMSATHASVDEKTRRRLMKGNFAIDARLDLHGLTVEDARAKTENIIERCYRSGAKCLLLVHGKGVGYGHKGNMGAIKAQVTDWLVSSPYVLAFHSAKPKHGGVGALYVLIRRPKDE